MGNPTTSSQGLSQWAANRFPPALGATTKDKFLISVPFWSILGRFVSEMGVRRCLYGPKMGRCPDRNKVGRVGHSGPFWAVLGHCPDLSLGKAITPAPLPESQGRSELDRVMIGTGHGSMVGKGYPGNQGAGVTGAKEPLVGPKRRSCRIRGPKRFEVEDKQEEVCHRHSGKSRHPEVPASLGPGCSFSCRDSAWPGVTRRWVR